MSLHDLSATTIDGKTQKLADYAGHVLLVANNRPPSAGSRRNTRGSRLLWRALSRQAGSSCWASRRTSSARRSRAPRPRSRTSARRSSRSASGMFKPRSPSRKRRSPPVYRFLAADHGVAEVELPQVPRGARRSGDRGVPVGDGASRTLLRAAIEAGARRRLDSAPGVARFSGPGWRSQVLKSSSSAPGPSGLALAPGSRARACGRASSSASREAPRHRRAPSPCRRRTLELSIASSASPTRRSSAGGRSTR